MGMNGGNGNGVNGANGNGGDSRHGSPAAPVVFGIVGAGAIAQAYSQAFRGLAAARVAAVADVRPEAARALAEELGCAAFASHQEMAERVQLDAVLVCTPPFSHAEICLHLLERGVAVLCEKPLALDAAGARRMVAAAEKAGVALTMASKFRYVEDVRRAKSIVASGILGEIVLFENSFTSRVDMSKRWNAQPRGPARLGAECIVGGAWHRGRGRGRRTAALRPGGGDDGGAARRPRLRGVGGGGAGASHRRALPGHRPRLAAAAAAAGRAVKKLVASLSLDLDNQWSYMRTHGDRGWESFPFYLDLVVPRVLDFLARRGLRITFFVVGQDAVLPANAAALAALAEAGHEIGNHSFHHLPWLHLFSEAEIEAEVAQTEEAIAAVTGQRPRGFRGPGFSLSGGTLRVLARRGYRYDASRPSLVRWPAPTTCWARACAAASAASGGGCSAPSAKGCGRWRRITGGWERRGCLRSR